MRGRWEEREKETGALLKGEMVMQAAWWGRALQVLNMDLWWSSITHWAIKGALHRRSSVNAVHASEHDHRACAHHRAALQWYKSAFKGGLNPCPFALTRHKVPPSYYVLPHIKETEQKQKGKTCDWGWLPAEQQRRCTVNPAGPPTMIFFFLF